MGKNKEYVKEFLCNGYNITAMKNNEEQNKVFESIVKKADASLVKDIKKFTDENNMNTDEAKSAVELALAYNGWVVVKNLHGIESDYHNSNIADADWIVMVKDYGDKDRRVIQNFLKTEMYETGILDSTNSFAVVTVNKDGKIRLEVRDTGDNLYASIGYTRKQNN